MLANGSNARGRVSVSGLNRTLNESARITACNVSSSVCGRKWYNRSERPYPPSEVEG